MSRRSLAIAIALPLMVSLMAAALLMPIPYVTSAPGLTVDVLSETEGQERIQVEGHETYYGDGELRMTTVSVTRPEDDISLAEGLSAWLDDDRAVQPHDQVYDDGETNEEKDTQGTIQMLNSQDAAVAVALDELGIDYEEFPAVRMVSEGAPADGRLQPGDRFLEIGGTEVTEIQEVVDAVSAAKPGVPLSFVVERDGARQTVEVTPTEIDGDVRVGVQVGLDFEFPLDVEIRINPDIGGPSAGLVFSLALYDTLTPGSLTGGHIIAGTGTIAPDGTVGPIGGIQQKIAGARQSDAELFLVPAENCEEALDADPGDMRLTRVATFDEGLEAIKAFADDPDASLPTCEKEG